MTQSCFFHWILAHSLHKLNTKGAEINSQSKYKVSMKFWAVDFCNLNNIIAMHFYMTATYFYMNVFHVSSGKKKEKNLSKIQSDKHERSPIEVKGTGCDYLRRQFDFLTMSYLSCSLLQYLSSLPLAMWLCYHYTALCILNAVCHLVILLHFVLVWVLTQGIQIRSSLSAL